MLDWHIGTLVSTKQTASDIKSLFFEIDSWAGHLAGQHCDIRLTAENGYQAQRSYSIASSPHEKHIEFGVQLLSDGEVSPFLWQMQPGDTVEIKGPIGGHFIWTPDMRTDVVLVGGGAGIAPLLAIYKHMQATQSKHRVIFIESAKTLEEIMYVEDLKDVLITRITSTEGRINQEFLQDKLATVDTGNVTTYICGPTEFVETVSASLVDLKFDPRSIKTERFG